jgi:hypothetical protein
MTDPSEAFMSIKLGNIGRNNSPALSSTGAILVVLFHLDGT